MILTNREKILLSVLVSLVIVIGGFVLILSPNQTKLNELQSNKAILEEEIQTVKTTIENRLDVEEKLKESNQLIKDNADKISPPLINEQFDLFLSKLASSYNVELISVSYDEATYVKPSVESAVDKHLPLKQVNRLENEGVILESTIKEASSELIHKYIVIDIEGSPTMIKNFIDGLYTGGYKTMFVNGVDISYEEQSASIILDMFSLPEVNWE